MQQEMHRRKSPISRPVRSRQKNKTAPGGDRSLKTQKILEQARQALAKNDLAAAREFLAQVPPQANSSKDVLPIHEELDIAVNKQVKELKSRGDREYRADDVMAAISTWSTALMLDPNNQQLNERLDRAGRVLVKLEQLRQIQGK